MTWTLQTLVDRLEVEGVDEPDAKQIALQKLDELVTRSGSLRKTISLGPTVADQRVYDVPATVARVRSLYIEDSEGTITRYPSRIGEDGMLAIRAGDMTAPSNCFAQDYNEDADLTVLIEPVWGTGGDDIKITAECHTAVTGLNQALGIPDAFAQGLVAGCRAVIIADQDENKAEAQALELEFESTIQRLREYMEARTAPTGPIQIPQRGIHFR